MDKSIFYYLKQSKHFKKNQLSNKKITDILSKDNKDYILLTQHISILKSKISHPEQNIEKNISFIEFSLASGNNNMGLILLFYNSKLFLDLIQCFILSLPVYKDKLLQLFVKILKEKNLLQYLAMNQSFFIKCLECLKHTKPSPSAIELCENLLISKQSLYRLTNMVNVIHDVYSEMIKVNRINIFCRIISIMIFDCHKMIEFNYKSLIEDNLKISLYIKKTLENQFVCLNFMSFLKNTIIKLSKIFETIKEISKETSLLPLSLISYLLNGLEENLNLVGFNQIAQNLQISPSINHPLESLEEFPEGDFSDIKTIPLTSSLNKKELIALLQLNIFESFIPNFEILKENPINIFNLYRLIAKEMSQIENKFKIHNNKQQYTNFLKIKTNQIEMLFVLSTLLSSRRRVEIQNKLNKYGIIDILDGYLDYMEWGNIFGNNARPIFDDSAINLNDDYAYHGKGCCCDSDSALKLQYLRLIYTFCNRDDFNIENKLKLFTLYDIDNFLNKGYLELIVMNIKEKLNFYKDVKYITFNDTFKSILDKIKANAFYKEVKYDDRKMEKILLKMLSIENIKESIELYSKKESKVGLLQKLIYKYIQECYYSSSKFWLSSCIEIMLRGNNVFFQTILGCSGLMPCLLYDILYSSKVQKKISQFSFDILGELIKFNRANFFILSYYLTDSNEFTEFFHIVLNKETLVDTNVFLRSIILSNYYFDIIDTKNNITFENSFIQKCKLCKQIEEYKISAFIKLIQLVKPNNLKQANISCINTAFIILIIEYLHGTLEDFLHNAVDALEDEAKAGLYNFEVLLIMWKKFYISRPNNAACLEFLSTIPFNIWLEVCFILLSKDPREKCSLYNIVSQ